MNILNMNLVAKSIGIYGEQYMNYKRLGDKLHEYDKITFHI